jgi:hypothetical protein
MGYKNLTPNNNSGNAIMRFILRLIAVNKILFTLHKGDVLCLQYPMKKFFTPACRLTHAKGAKVITIVHDLGAFRRHKLTIEQENRRLANSDVIIVLDHGRIIERGTHDDLIAQRGTYYQLYTGAFELE